MREVKFRRKTAENPVEDTPTGAEASGTTEDVTPGAPDTTGPFDASAVAGDSVPRIDLGSLLVPHIEGRELRLQVDEASGVVRAVMLVGAEGMLEFQAFAAPRNGDLWSTVRPQIAEDIARRGGTAAEREGRWGTELTCTMTVTGADGAPAVQPSRVLGINGDRWMLRASFLGRPAVEPESSQDWEDTLAQVVVRRGTEAMPVGEPLTVKLPDDARRTS